MNEEATDGEVAKAKETIKRGAKSGAFAAASGGITLARGLNALRKRQWKRGVVRLLAAGFWFGVAAVQRNLGDRGPPFDEDDVDQRSVADTSPDIGDVATDADEGTGTESHGDPSDVVDTTSVDIDESDTATEHDSQVDTDPADAVDTTTADIDESDTATEHDTDADETDVDQRDVADTNVGADDVQRAAEPGDTDDATGDDEPEPESLDDDAEPAITESDGGAADEADDDEE